jgi:hypothetical protein
MTSPVHTFNAADWKRLMDYPGDPISVDDRRATGEVGEERLLKRARFISSARVNHPISREHP